MLILTKKAMVTEKRSGGIATFIPNVGTRWGLVVSLTWWPLYPMGKESP
jgi:hypothetical protein